MLLLLFCGFVTPRFLAEGPAFDLSGPKIDVRVKRAEVTLPIGQTPNLMPGDRLWVHPDFPESQATHFVLVIAFLRGATNQPPAEWFTRVETWTRAAREEGIFVTVPAEAQQALLFLAPETSGDFSTLRKTVHDRPGAFVRAAQDLQAASADRMRLESYLAEVKETSQTDPKSLKQHAEMAARALGIRIDQQCFDKPSEQQAPCLTQHTDGIVLDDANAGSLMDEWTSGSSRDLVNQLSYSQIGGAGAFSPYVGAIVDTVRILSTVHTAHFQYIPALALPTNDTLNLRLNVPPSFRDPKSVVVVALPPVGPAKQPALHPVNPAENYCAQKPGLVLPVEGAPMIFASDLARSLVLRVEGKGSAARMDLPVKAETAQGGLALDSTAPRLPEPDVTAVLHGKWGFDDWEGPHFHLHSAEPGKWVVAAGDQSALVVGRDDTLHLAGESALCVDRVELAGQGEGGSPLKLSWKSPKPEGMDVTVPMKEVRPGPVSLNIFQFGLDKPDTLALKAYAEAASLDRLTLSAGDTLALLKGTRLDEVEKAEFAGITWTPKALNRVADYDQLAMSASGSTAGLDPGQSYTAVVQLRDGRALKAPVTVDARRPQVVLLNKAAGAATAPSLVQLGSKDDIPVDQRLVFFVKSVVPASFPRDEKIEVAAADGSFHVELSLADNSLILADATTAYASIDPLARFGYSAFGPIQLRAVSAKGIAGDWIPLGTLVRIPGFKELHCPRSANKPCTLTGSNLFLIAAIASTADFSDSQELPPDFTGSQLTVPHPANGVLYLKLRDDPGTAQTLTLPVLLMQGPQPQQAPPSSPEAPATSHDPVDKAGP